jgi:hypothetical protein
MKKKTLFLLILVSHDIYAFRAYYLYEVINDTEKRVNHSIYLHHVYSNHTCLYTEPINSFITQAVTRCYELIDAVYDVRNPFGGPWLQMSLRYIEAFAFNQNPSSLRSLLTLPSYTILRKWLVFWLSRGFNLYSGNWKKRGISAIYNFNLLFCAQTSVGKIGVELRRAKGLKRYLAGLSCLTGTRLFFWKKAISWSSLVKWLFFKDHLPRAMKDRYGYISWAVHGTRNWSCF